METLVDLLLRWLEKIKKMDESYGIEFFKKTKRLHGLVQALLTMLTSKRSKNGSITWFVPLPRMQSSPPGSLYMVFIYRLIYGISWAVPLPSNSDHQDCFMFSRGSQPKPSFATVTGEGGQPNVCYTSSQNHGSVKNGCISNRIVAFQIYSHFPLNHELGKE